MRKIIVEPQIFEKFPALYAVSLLSIILRTQLQNPGIEKILQEAIEQEAGKHSVDSALKAWDTVHTAFGSNPNRFPPSIKSLLKRIDKGVPSHLLIP